MTTYHLAHPSGNWVTYHLTPTQEGVALVMSGHEDPRGQYNIKVLTYDHARDLWRKAVKEGFKHYATTNARQFIVEQFHEPVAGQEVAS